MKQANNASRVSESAVDEKPATDNGASPAEEAGASTLEKPGMKLSILGREFVVACEDEQKESLDRAARHLDEQMRTIRDQGKVLGMERCAIMAALSLSYELLEMRGQTQDASNRDERLRLLNEKIDSVMAETQQVSLQG